MIELDKDGIVSSFRLFPVGESQMTLENGEAVLTLSESDIDSIVGRAQETQRRTPIDGEHFLHHLAKTQGVDEDELILSAPYTQGMGTLGFGSLEKRPDGVWLNQIKWNDSAKFLLKNSQYKYFSPVIKGLDKKSPLRITSVALTNTPRMRDVAEIAASEATEEIFNTIPITQPQPTNTKKETPKMEALKKMIADFLGIDVVLLETPEGVADAKKKLETKIKDATDLATEVKTELALSDANAQVVKGALRALSAKSKQADELSTRVATLELSEKNRKLDDLILQGKKEGKITEATASSLRELGEVALGEYLKVAPVIVPQGTLNLPRPNNTDEVVLSDSDKSVARSMGLTEEQFLNAKKGK